MWVNRLYDINKNSLYTKPEWKYNYLNGWGGSLRLEGKGWWSGSCSFSGPSSLCSPPSGWCSGGLGPTAPSSPTTTTSGGLWPGCVRVIIIIERMAVTRKWFRPQTETLNKISLTFYKRIHIDTLTWRIDSMPLVLCISCNSSFFSLICVNGWLP